MPTAQARVPHKMSYEEFLDWCEEDTLAEWVDGEVISMSSASFSHQWCDVSWLWQEPLPTTLNVRQELGVL